MSNPVVVRLIDKETGTRTRPMKVLVLGLSRTGTVSIYTALRQLGYHPYHMLEAMKDPKRRLALWEEALKAKFLGIGKPYGREEFDKLLGEYDGVADQPCIEFADELIALYPDAKVILTNRDVDKWIISFKATALECFRWTSWQWIAPLDPSVAQPLYHFAIFILGLFVGRPNYDPTQYFSDEYLGLLRQAYLDHYAHVREITPKERLLEFKSEDGWEPLCAFLGKEVPEGKYPKVNDSKGFVNMHKMLLCMAVGKWVAKRLVLPAVVAGGAAWWVWRSKA